MRHALGTIQAQGLRYRSERRLAHALNTAGDAAKPNLWWFLPLAQIAEHGLERQQRFHGPGRAVVYG